MAKSNGMNIAVGAVGILAAVVYGPGLLKKLTPTTAAATKTTATTPVTAVPSEDDSSDTSTGGTVSSIVSSIASLVKSLTGSGGSSSGKGSGSGSGGGGSMGGGSAPAGGSATKTAAASQTADTPTTAGQVQSEIDANGGIYGPSETSTNTAATAQEPYILEDYSAENDVMNLSAFNDGGLGDEYEGEDD